MKNLFSLLIALFSLSASAQLSDGSTAPNFTLTDINGTEHTLYDYLDQGKTVYLEFFAAHCPVCWAYHNTNNYKNLHNQHGVNGSISQDVVVLAIEYDPNNGINEITGVSGVTQGNWTEGVTYPIFNPEGATRASIISGFAVSYYPLIYAICPDKTVANTGTVSTAMLYSFSESCSTVGMTDSTAAMEPSVRYLPSSSSLLIEDYPDFGKLSVLDLTGKNVFESRILPGNQSLALHLMTGIYICRFVDINGKIISKKVAVH